MDNHVEEVIKKFSICKKFRTNFMIKKLTKYEISERRKIWHAEILKAHVVSNFLTPWGPYEAQQFSDTYFHDRDQI